VNDEILGAIGGAAPDCGGPVPHCPGLRCPAESGPGDPTAAPAHQIPWHSMQTNVWRCLAKTAKHLFIKNTSEFDEMEEPDWGRDSPMGFQTIASDGCAMTPVSRMCLHDTTLFCVKVVSTQHMATSSHTTSSVLVLSFFHSSRGVSRLVPQINSIAPESAKAIGTNQGTKISFSVAHWPTKLRTNTGPCPTREEDLMPAHLFLFTPRRPQ